jgi:ABC-type phosphate transport system substrate-binding protein
MRKLLTYLLFAFSLSVNADVVVLYNEPIHSISRDEIYAIYTLRKTKWDTGTSIQLYMLPASLMESVYFANLIAGTSPQRLRRIQELADMKSFAKIRWMKTSDGVAEDIVKYMGSIGYVRKDVSLGHTVNVVVFE